MFDIEKKMLEKSKTVYPAIEATINDKEIVY